MENNTPANSQATIPSDTPITEQVKPQTETPQQPPAVTPQQPKEPATPSKSKKWLLPLIIIIVVFILGTAGYYIYRNYQSKQKVVQTQPTPIPVSDFPSPTTDPTVNWKTYTNSKYRLSFNYPQDYEFEENNLEIGTVAWMGTMSKPNNIVDKDTKVWEIVNINAAVRRKLGLTFDQWVNNECRSSDLKDVQNIQVDNKQAKKLICSLGKIDNEEYTWEIVVVDNGDYVYTLTNTGHNRDTELVKVFDQILSTFKFIE